MRKQPADRESPHAWELLGKVAARRSGALEVASHPGETDAQECEWRLGQEFCEQVRGLHLCNCGGIGKR